MPSDLILVTGASSDIGMALLRLLLTTTDTRILAHCHSNREKLDALAIEFIHRVEVLQADLSNPSSTQVLAQQLVDLDTPTGFVHLPALRLAPERFTKVRWELLERDLFVQVGSAVVLLQKLLPRMTKLRRARVVFMLTSSVHGIPPKFLSQYTMVKYAQLGLMRSLAAEYAATPVRINAVSPSMVETKFLQDLSDLAVQAAAAGHPLGRNAQPHDIVGAIRFLLSEEADFISGVTLPVAGGMVS
jgi:NAD(P)-dependent dehydrogenase (short-subunit alcohol dehydrogenase family)